MNKIKTFFSGLTKKQIILFIAIFICLLSFTVIPAFASHKNKINLNELSLWDGSIASSYRRGTGTEEDPYIIASGEELAYLATNNEDTTNKYYKLSNNIVINNGIFEYEDNNILYTLDGDTYYVKPYTNQCYSDEELTSFVGRINIFSNIDNFKGNLDANSYTIYGLYMTNSTEEELALFTKLSGSIKDLYLENSFIYGGDITATLASTTNNATITNVLVNGITTSNSNVREKTITKTVSDIQEASTNDELTVTRNLEYKQDTANLKNSKVTGTVTLSTGDLTTTNLTINGTRVTSNSFELDLGTNYINKLVVKMSSPTPTVVTISNIVYEETYYESVTSNIVGIAKGSTLTGLINNGKVFGNTIGAGLVGVSVDTTLIDSYNTGDITGSISAGVIGETLSTPTTITNVYNKGTATYGLVGIINANSTTTLTSVFDSTASTKIGARVSTVNIVNGYKLSGNDVGFITTTEANLKNATFMNNLGFVTYDEEDIENKKWIYLPDIYPVLYFDDITEPIAKININAHNWDRETYTLSRINLKNNTTFNIATISELRPVKEAYYYISTSSTPLTKEQVRSISAWEEYNSVVSLSQEGYYIIYAKVTDYNDEVYYLNSDVLVLDKTGAVITIAIGNENVDHETSSYPIFYNANKNIVLSATDNLTGVKELSYYLSNTTLTNADLEETEWVTYTNAISFDSSSKKMLYVKAVDNNDNVTYENTPYISVNGYTKSNLILGRSTSNNLNNISITNDSSISFTSTFTSNETLSNNKKHVLVASTTLPVNTVITLIDNSNKKVYKYTVRGNEDTKYEEVGKYLYFLESFKTLKQTAEYYSETSSLTSDYKITIDFKDATIVNNISNLSVDMGIYDNSMIVVDTLQSTKNVFNIVKNAKANLFISSSFTGSIVYNSNSSTNIPILTGVSLTNNVFDTTIENKNIGLIIRLTDASGNLVDKKHLKNLSLSINGDECSVNSNGLYRVNLTGTSNKNITLNVTTMADNSRLPSGTYYLKISPYIAYDGINTNTISEQLISIPVVVTNSFTTRNYIYDVIMDEANKIIPKNSITKTINFSVIEKGTFTAPSIRVSLYEKDDLTAYSQDYTKVDLGNYISNNLTSLGNNNYLLVANPVRYNGTVNTYNNVSLTFDTRRFNYNSYKLVFELYDGNTRIGIVDKYFIVK